MNDGTIVLFEKEYKILLSQLSAQIFSGYAANSKICASGFDFHIENCVKDAKKIIQKIGIKYQ